jgi:hypothetical protein
MLRNQGAVAVTVVFLLSSVSEGKIPPKLQGKVFCSTQRIKDVAAEALIRIFSEKTAKADVPREKNGRWKTTLVAFFRKESIPGPMTIWLLDKDDKEALKANEPTQVISAESTPKEVFVNDIELDPDQGFNKGRTYLIRVGQIINKAPKIYATGEIVLGK